MLPATYHGVRGLEALLDVEVSLLSLHEAYEPMAGKCLELARALATPYSLFYTGLNDI